MQNKLVCIDILLTTVSEFSGCSERVPRLLLVVTAAWTSFCKVHNKIIINGISEYCTLAQFNYNLHFCNVQFTALHASLQFK
jgi:hypothetical protein